MENWISIKSSLPQEGQRVRYRMEQNRDLFNIYYVEDCGIYLNNRFVTIDARLEAPIIDWKPM